MKRVGEKISKYESLFLILVFLVLLRLPSLYEPAWYGDENIYLTIGQGIRKGLVLYRDITDFPNKPPLIYFLAAVTKSVFWMKLALLVWNGIHTIFVFLLLKEIFPRKKWVWNTFTVAFVLLTSLPMLEGNVANAEMFMAMPVTAGMFLMWREFVSDKRKSRRKRFHPRVFLSGVIFAVGFLFKIPVAVDIAAALLFFFVLRRRSGVSLAQIKRLIVDKRLYEFLLGLTIPVALAMGFHALQGVSPLTLFINAGGSTGYVSVWTPQQGIEALLTFSTLFSRLVLLGGIVLLLYFKRNKLSKEVLFASLWVSFTVFGALLSARPYPHYLLQVIPALVVLISSILAVTVIKRNTLTLVGLILLVSFMAYVRFEFSTYPVLSYYVNFGKFLTGKITTQEFYDGFDGRMSRNYQVAEYLRLHTKPDERIYIWGTEPGIYVLSDRLPVGRLTTSFHVEDLQEYERLGNELAQTKPRYIVTMESEPREFMQLKKLLDLSYTRVHEINEAQIYRLLPDV